MSDTQDKTDTTQDKGGKDSKSTLTQEAFDALIVERDKLNIELRGLKSTSADSVKLQKQLDDTIQRASKAEGLIESMKTEARDATLTTTLKTALESVAKTGMAATAAKLIDRTKIKFDDNGQVDMSSVEAAIEAVKVSDAGLFGAADDPQKGDPKASPDVQRVAPKDKTVQGGTYESDLKLAMAGKGPKGNSQLDIPDVLRKYGKM